MTRHQTKPRIVVLGAGPAGLGAAFKLRQTDQAEVIVVERNSMVGGNAASFKVGDQRVDFGSHRLHPSCDPEILGDIRSLLGSDLLKRPRRGRILLRGQWIHFPLKPLDLLLRLDRGFAFGALRDMLTRGGRRREPANQTFASVLRTQLGPTICEQFYLPYATKIWGQDPDRLSAVQAQRRVAVGSFAKLLRKVFSAVPGVRPVGFDHFYYPRQGFGQISEAYAEAARAAGAIIALNEPVVRLLSLGAHESGWRVITDRSHGQHSFEADQVWSTIPITVLARLVEPSPEPEILAAADAIQYRAMILIYLQLGVDRFSDFDAHYFPDPDIAITRLSEPRNYSAIGGREGSTVLCAELPCSADDAYWQMPSEMLADLVGHDLERAGLSLPRAPISVQVRRLPQAYPMYKLGYEEHFAQLDAWVERQSGLLTFGRQGLFVHDNTHHALFMAYGAAGCLIDGEWDQERWQRLRSIFETHVVED